MYICTRLPRCRGHRFGGQARQVLLKHSDLVAQLVEHLPFKERVLGSSPSQVTNKRKTRLARGGFIVSKQ